MHRFYLPPDSCRGEILTLPEREAHHAAHVLRLRRGERISVLDGEGQIIEAEVAEVSRKVLRAIVRGRTLAARPHWRITLAQAIPKGKMMESIIQKATELGVARIVPLLTERVIIHLDEEDAANKEERWQHTAVEALKQSGNPWLSRVSLPVTPAQFLAEKEEFELALIGSLRDDARHSRHYFDRFRERHGRSPSSACLWIGPEGDFTDAEMEAARVGGAQPIDLGPLVLRCETAAIASLAIVNYEMRWPAEAARPVSSPAGNF